MGMECAVAAKVGAASDAAVVTAARLTGHHKAILRLPEAYATQVDLPCPSGAQGPGSASAASPAAREKSA